MRTPQIFLLALSALVIAAPGSQQIPAEEKAFNAAKSQSMGQIVQDTAFWTEGMKLGKPPGAGSFKKGASVRVIESIDGYKFVESTENKNKAGWIVESAFNLTAPPIPDAAPPAKTAKPHKVRPHSEQPTNAARASHQFAFDLYKHLARPSENLFLSPISVEAVLQILLAGATGPTADEIKNVLHLTRSQADKENPFVPDLPTQPESGFEMICANHLWVAHDMMLKPEFQAKVQHGYQAEIDEFSDAAALNDEIGKWLSAKTHEKITDTPIQPTSGQTVKLVAINATYFKADWAWKDVDPDVKRTGFPKKKARKFRTENNKSIDVDMMVATATLRLAEFETLQVLELPYVGGAYSAILLLPTGRENLQKLEEKLTTGNLSQWLDGLDTPVDVYIEIPPFQLSNLLPLKEALGRMKMPLAFTMDADFSHIAEQRLRISEIAHAAYVDFNEKGTTVAGGTKAVVVGAGSRRQFQAVRPFLFLIRENRQGTIVFMGRIANPSNNDGQKAP